METHIGVETRKSKRRSGSEEQKKEAAKELPTEHPLKLIIKPRKLKEIDGFEQALVASIIAALGKLLIHCDPNQFPKDLSGETLRSRILEWDCVKQDDANSAQILKVLKDDLARLPWDTIKALTHILKLEAGIENSRGRKTMVVSNRSELERKIGEVLVLPTPFTKKEETKEETKEEPKKEEKLEELKEEELEVSKEKSKEKSPSLPALPEPSYSLNNNNDSNNNNEDDVNHPKKINVSPTVFSSSPGINVLPVAHPPLGIKNFMGKFHMDQARDKSMMPIPMVMTANLLNEKDDIDSKDNKEVLVVKTGRSRKRAPAVETQFTTAAKKNKSLSALQFHDTSNRFQDKEKPKSNPLNLFNINNNPNAPENQQQPVTDPLHDIVQALVKPDKGCSVYFDGVHCICTHPIILFSNNTPDCLL